MCVFPRGALDLAKLTGFLWGAASPATPAWKPWPVSPDPFRQMMLSQQARNTVMPTAGRKRVRIGRCMCSNAAEREGDTGGRDRGTLALSRRSYDPGAWACHGIVMHKPPILA